MPDDRYPRSLFSERLRLLRKANALTQKEVAKQLNIDRSTYAYYETDKTRPDYDTLQRLCRIFGVNLDYILGGEMDPSVGIPLRNKGTTHEDRNVTLSELTRDEIAILTIYRQLDGMEKNAFMQYALQLHYQKMAIRENGKTDG